MKKRSSSQKNQKPTVKTKGTQERVTIGMDLGDKTSRYCMFSNEGEILREVQVTTSKAGMVEAFGSLGRVRAALMAVRTSLVNTVRGLAKSMGERLPPCDADQMGISRARSLPLKLRQVLEPLLKEVESLTKKIKD